ncbi:MAG TPA: sigma-70 family RNA polymerase sigma factor [Candidatus Angelobacter sp.]
MELDRLRFFPAHGLTMPGNRRFEFESVALPHAAGLLRYALHLESNKAQAEDLVQETLLSAWRSFHQFQPGTNCKAWLFRILKNLYFKQVRQTRQKPEVPVEEWEPAFAAPEKISATQEMQEAFARLTAEHKEVLHLAVVEGFGIREIAELLQVPPGTIMSRLSRARASLRAILQGRTLVREGGL